MGKSIRSKREKALRTIKRNNLMPEEQVKIKALHDKLNAIVAGARAAKVPDIEHVEEKNPSKVRPYTFNFLLARNKQLSNNNVEMTDNSNNNTSNNQTEGRVTRGRDRTVKPSAATNVLKNLQKDREEKAALLPDEQERKFHTNQKKSTKPGTTTNAPRRGRAVKREDNAVEDMTVDSENHNNPAIKIESDDEVNMEAVSYVQLGKSSHTRRSKLQKEHREAKEQQQRGRSKSRGRNAVVSNWHKLK
jgi:hypothetical protein